MLPLKVSTVRVRPSMSISNCLERASRVIARRPVRGRTIRAKKGSAARAAVAMRSSKRR